MKHFYIKYLIAALFCCVMLTGCTNIKMPHVSDAGITNFKMRGLTSADIFFSMRVENPNKKTLAVESVSGTVFKDDMELGIFTLAGDTLIAPGLTTSTIKGCLKITATNPLGVIAAGINLSNPNLEALRADAIVKIRYGKSGKKLKFTDCTLSDFTHYLSQ